MPELRKDELSGRWVLLAPGRAARPHAFSPPLADADASPADCPFCPGNEHETPPEVMRTGEGAPDTPGWRVRVVPNLYPFVGGEDARPGVTGTHEVVILSPAHDRSFGRLADEEAVEAVTVMRDRRAITSPLGGRTCRFAVNQGPAAGVSIADPHAQVIALDFVPPVVTAALERVNAVGDDLVAAAAAGAPGAGLAVVEGPAPAWCPEAASGPYVVRVPPTGPRAPGSTRRPTPSSASSPGRRGRCWLGSGSVAATRPTTWSSIPRPGAARVLPLVCRDHAPAHRPRRLRARYRGVRQRGRARDRGPRSFGTPPYRERPYPGMRHHRRVAGRGLGRGGAHRTAFGMDGRRFRHQVPGETPRRRGHRVRVADQGRTVRAPTTSPSLPSGSPGGRWASCTAAS